MPAVVERGEAPPPAVGAVSAESVRWAGPAVGTALAGLVAAAVLAGGGSSSERLYPLGAAAIVLAAAAVVAAALGLLPRPRLGRSVVVALALLGAFALWAAATVAWSTLPDRSWDFFNRTGVYLALLVLGLLAGAYLQRAASRTAAVLSAIIGVALVWALAGKVIPALFPDGARTARLREPIGYWNALGLLFSTGLPLALWVASERRHRIVVRAAGVTGFYALVVALLLTYSRGGVLTAVVAVAAWLVLGSPRLESMVALVLATPVALAVAKWTFGRPGVVDDGQPHGARVVDGWHFGVVLGLGAAAVFGAAYALARAEGARPWPPKRRARAARFLALGLGAGTAVALVVLTIRTDPLERLDARLGAGSGSCQQVTQDASRLTDFSLNQRWCWWNEAWRGFRDEPLRGTGAGSFEATHLVYRGSNVTVTEVHNLPLQVLSETGIVGFVLFLGALGAALAGVAATLRRLSGAERAAAAALAAGLVAYLVHALADVDWDFVAVSAPFVAVLGVLLTAGQPAVPGRRRPLVAAAAGVVGVVLVFSLTAPWLAHGRTEAAYDRLGAGDAAAALDAAESAQTLNPLALEALLAEADARAALGDTAGAERALLDAVELQPRNWRSWYALGSFQLRLGEARSALRTLDPAYALNPQGPAGALLDQARAIVEGRA